MRVAVVGTGNIGGYLGITLSAAGADVTMLYRPGRVETAEADFAIGHGGQRYERAPSTVLTDDPHRIEGVDLCLVCVKSYDTEAAADLLGALEAPPAWVLSLQNGLGNVTWLRKRLEDRVLGGVVAFNVIRSAGGIRHKTTRGPIFVENRPEARDILGALRSRLQSAGERVEVRDDIERVQAGKLLVNLSNGVCAAAGLTVAEMLRDRDARWCFAECLEEGTRILRSAGIDPARVALLPATWMARFLRLPDPILSLGLRLSRAVDEDARVSTLEDLQGGRPTEISVLNGSVVRLAERAGTRAPANETVTRTVHQHEDMVRAGELIRFAPAHELRAKIEHASNSS